MRTDTYSRSGMQSAGETHTPVDPGAGERVRTATCRLQEVRPRAASALATPMAHVFALTALEALGLSRASFHDTFHADGGQRSVTVTERSDRNPPPV